MKLEDCLPRTRVKLIKEFSPPQFPLYSIKPGAIGRLRSVMESEWDGVEHYATVWFDGNSVGTTLPLSYLELV